MREIEREFAEQLNVPDQDSSAEEPERPFPGSSKLLQFTEWLEKQSDCKALRAEITFLRWLELLPSDSKLSVNHLGTNFTLEQASLDSCGHISSRDVPYTLQFALMRYCSERELGVSFSGPIPLMEIHEPNLHT